MQHRPAGIFCYFEIYATPFDFLHFSVESRYAAYDLAPSRLTSTRLGSKKIPRVIALRTRGSLLPKNKNTECHIAYDTRLRYEMAGQMPQAAY